MGMLTHHEKRAEIHPPQYRILHLGNLEKYSQKLLFSLQACQKCGGRSLKIRFMLVIVYIKHLILFGNTVHMFIVRHFYVR